MDDEAKTLTLDPRPGLSTTAEVPLGAIPGSPTITCDPIMTPCKTAGWAVPSIPGYKVIRETFTSQVTLDRQALTIRADYLDGPFRFMENLWTFAPAGEGQSDIRFHIAYEFKSRAPALLMGTMFDRVFRSFSEAFEKRADVIYGKSDATGEGKP